MSPGGPGPRPARLRRDAQALAAPLPPLVVEAERIAATVALGVHGRRRPGMGETFWEYRRHRHEDGAARVDWRRSARSDALFVRENEWEAAQTILLWRDGRASMDFASTPGGPTKKDRAALLTIALAALLTRGGERVAVPGESAAPRAGRVGFERVSMRLAEGPGLPENLAPTLPTARGRLVIASDFLDPVEDWAARLRPFLAQGVTGALVQVVDPAEEDFPFEGRVVFLEPGGAEKLVIGRAQSVREGYRRRFIAQRAAVCDLARRSGWTFIAHRSDHPPADALLALHAALGEGRR